MHRGRSPEERMLAGEECGFSLRDFGNKLLSFTGTPAGKLASMAVLPAPLTAVLVSQMSRKAPARKEIVDRRPAPQAPTRDAAAPAAGPPKAAVAGWMMGADAPMTHAQIQKMIRNEGNPFKQMRMMSNYKRSL